MKPSHYGMKELSYREKIAIGEFLRKATEEGGLPLRLVAKKLIMTTYWTHMTLWSYYDSYDTVWCLLQRIYPPKPGETIEDAIKREVHNIAPWLGVNDLTAVYQPLYKRISTNTILSKDPHSMKIFETELRIAIQNNKEDSKTLPGYFLNRTPIPDLPI